MVLVDNSFIILMATKEELEVLLKKIQNKEVTEEEVAVFLKEVGTLLDEVIAVAK